ncbi:hypothetical protein OKW21_004559 [Catalinimonas alkaloidigena]|uniref:hypothetical protein n=1 Tax=Catalinimonas alkaloidigena TaxID=1075417 RepID=UPI00240772FE|nr:hypothetical protein [Catalinimonas alkaloidigena]MDF9799296.1 hypothetical protein [Catalinimonas alkaloidigena]
MKISASFINFSKRTLLFSLIIIAICTGISWGKPSFFEKGPKEEIKSYIETNVLPVIRGQRQKLEDELSAEEKQKLSTLRAQMQKLKDQHKEGFSKASMREEPTKEEWEAQKSLREERKQLMDELMPIAKQHESTINQLTAEIEGQQLQWKSDIQAIVTLLEDADESNSIFSPPRKAYEELVFGHPALFLLLDPDATPSEGSSQSHLYPNPVNEASIFEYQLAKKGPVIISLFDAEGISVKTLVYEIQDPGNYRISMESDKLAPGTYEYSFSTAEKTETGHFMKL